MIEFFNVSKVYNDHVYALQGVNLSIEKGEFVFLVGPSGAGKTTFVKLLYRQEKASKGQVFFDGYNLGKLRRKDIPFYRRRIGVVFQDFKLLPQKTAYENVAFALVVTEATQKEIEKKVPSILEMVGLEDKWNSYPHELSGGEQQRVAIARALVNTPQLLIADEPTGNLDPDTSWEIMDLISRVNRMGTTVLMATHARDIVNTMKKRVIALENGQVVRDQAKGGYGDEA